MEREQVGAKRCHCWRAEYTNRFETHVVVYSLLSQHGDSTKDDAVSYEVARVNQLNQIKMWDIHVSHLKPRINEFPRRINTPDECSLLAVAQGV